MSIICPIGTCRIHTAIARARATHEFVLERTKNYGFTHTAFEARQQLRFMLGHIEIPEHIRPVLFRDTKDSTYSDPLPATPDIFFVEVSSAKKLLIDGFAVQINYLYRRFDEILSEPALRNRFSELAGRQSPEALHDWLEAQPAFSRMSAEDQALLKKVRVSSETKEGILKALSDIADMVGRDKLIVTTHVDAFAANGERLEKRSANINNVITACEKQDIPCYNPTALMLQTGQENALKKEGRDLTHFTEEFCDLLFLDWNKRYFGFPARDNVDVAVIKGFDRSLLVNATEAEDIFIASRALRQAVREYPGNQPLQMELARFEYRLGNFEAALAYYNSLGQDSNLTDLDLEAWLVSTYRVGEYQEALKLGETLLGDEIEFPNIYATVARSAAAVGQTDLAIARWKQLFFRGENALEAASEILDLLDSGRNAETKKDEWVAQVLERYPEHEDALAVLWQSAIKKRSIDRLLYLLGRSRRMSDETALSIADECCEVELQAIGMQLAVGREATTDTSYQVYEWSERRRTNWLEEGQEALEAGDIVRAAQLINGASIALKADAARAHRKLEKAFLVRAREAYKVKDFEEVLQTFCDARAALLEFRQMHLLAGRAFYALENYEAATQQLLIEASQNPFDLRLSWALARAAIYAERYEVAIDQLRLIEQSDETNSKEREDALLKLERLVGRAIRQIRELTDEGRFDEARRLLDKVTAIDGSGERADREKKKLASAIGKQIKVLEPSQFEKRLALGKRLFELDPENLYAAKSAAVGAMKIGKWEQALEYFEAMRPLTDDKEQVDRNIAKCRNKLDKMAA